MDMEIARMRDIYLRELDAIKSPSEAERLNRFSSVMRSVLQALAITSLEIAAKITPSTDSNPLMRSYIERFGQPSDGLPIETLDKIIPIVRSYAARSYMHGWFEARQDESGPLVRELVEWVEFRNRKPGHGVLDQDDTADWALRTERILRRLLATLGSHLPTVDDEGRLFVTAGPHKIQLTTPLVNHGHALVVSRVGPRKGTWQMHVQLLSWSNARQLIVDLPPVNLFSYAEDPTDKFRVTEVIRTGPPVLIMNTVPIRQTATFVGRKKELEKLTDWFDDVEDSRTCLVYGDGGVGKTTLALEFFNNLLDGLVETSTRIPSIISFYTAKQTKWTDEGLVHFKGISDAMEDGVRELLYFVFPVLDKEWYKLSGSALIDKVAGVFRDQKFDRNDILLIIDNTETLATSQIDTEELANFLTRVAKRIGRVVITSRRREFLAATPIAVSSLSESEAVQLIVRLGAAYGAKAVENSSDARLRSACEKLMFKPLLIDTLVRYIARSHVGLREGLDHILTKTNDELLEFLYEDAWLRMNHLAREVFMVLVKLGIPLNSKSIGDVCREIGVQHAEFQASLSETYFATVVDYGGTYELEIVDLAKKFFEQKLTKLGLMEKERIEKIAFKADKLGTQRHDIEMNYKHDRVADAFRSDLAKAAKIATIRRRYDEANLNFVLALQEEPLNAALHERYASFLFRMQSQPEAALPVVEKAIELDPRSADAWLTLALILYKVDRLKDGDFAIRKAHEFGKTESLCTLRMAIARYHAARERPEEKGAIILLREAETLLDNSSKTANQNDIYHAKNMADVERHVVLIRQLIPKVSQHEARHTRAR
jgi:tetratricopeptide (TPR) repeat protein